MANPILQATTTAQVQNAPLVLTNPSGLAVGDQMIIFATLYETGSNQSINSLVGWTSQHNSENDFVSSACFTKTADASDVSAGSVTLTSTGGSDYFSGSFHRVTGAATGSEIAATEIDIGSATPSVSYVTSITPPTNESLVIVCFSGADNSISTAPTALSFSLTPSATFTKVADEGQQSGGGSGSGIAHAVAWADYDGVTEITARGATFSTDITRGNKGIIIVYSTPQDSSGTNALLESSPVFWEGNGSAGTTGTNDLLDSSPEMYGQNGSATQMTRWENENKASTSWTNEQPL